MGSSTTSPEMSASTKQPARSWRRMAGWFIAGLMTLALAGAGYVWLQRDQIAGNFIDDALRQNGLEARYEIVEIGTQRQVIENLSIGEEAAPDFRAKRISIDVAYGLAGPEIGQITIEGARLFGGVKDGLPSLGALDAVIFGESEEGTGLPAIDLKLIDAGALFETEYGMIAAKLSGEGALDDGFEGRLAMTAPGFGTSRCKADTLSAYGTLSTSAGKPRFEGPVRASAVECEGAMVARGDITADLTLGDDLISGDGEFALSMADLAYSEADTAIAALSGDVRLGWNGDQVTLSHDLNAENLTAQQATLASLDLEGRLRAASDFAQADWSADLAGEGIALTGALSQTLAEARKAVEGTLGEPLLAKFERGLRRGVNGGTAGAELNWRLRDGEYAVVIPQARVLSAAGEPVLAISRASWSAASNGEALPRIAGNILLGGADLPAINGRMEQLSGGELGLRLAMAPYRAGSSQLAVPSLQLRQMPGGAVRFVGMAQASGPVPGGSVTALEVPLEGSITPSGRLALGTKCETIRFGALALGELALEGRAMRLCPQNGAPLLSYNGELKAGATTGPLELTGLLSETETQITLDAASLSYPGAFAIEGLSASRGTGDEAYALELASLDGALGEELGGTFEGGRFALPDAEIGISAVGGAWAYSQDILTISEASATITDESEGLGLFEPLEASRASLTLEGDIIRADGLLLLKSTGTKLADVDLRHDLSANEGEGAGDARLTMNALTFGDDLRLIDLLPLAKGVIAYTEGSVSGEGRIEWVGDQVTSSGTLRSDGLDLAAAFGPVRELKGTIEFSDLLALTTKPDQVVEIGAINPGIEVLSGRIVFAMREGTNIDVTSARWPFMGGELIMRPVTLRYGSDEEQRYTFEIIGLDAAKFVTQMELANLGATGTFDGTVPIIFDLDGNGRIEDGLLISRPPGGNVSYVGELLYEDMGTVANYAFESLRSLDYRQMSVALGGDLAGEIITKFQFDGIRQGEGAAQNFVTRRLATLPIRFNVNVRSENFYELATMVRTFIDASALPDPVDQGLLGAEDGRFVRPLPPGVPPSAVATELPPSGPPEEPANPDQPSALRPDEPAVQPPDSEERQ